MDLKDLVEHVLREKDGLVGLEVVKLTEEPCSKPGDNFMSVVSVVKIQGTLPGETSQPYSGSLFLKRPVATDKRMPFMQLDEAFHNEAVMYSSMLPMCVRNVTVAVPRCYHADSDVIVLQDLLAAGYSMADRRLGCDLKMARQALKALAGFHVSSYYRLATQRDEFMEIAKLFKPINLTSSANIPMTDVCIRRAFSHLQVSEFEDLLPTMKKLQENAHGTLKELRQAGKISVLCHGDFWINNLLFSEDPKDPIRIIDFQQCAVFSPAVDVMSFIYTSVQPSMLEEHIEDLLQFYCKSFVLQLATLKVPLEYLLLSSDLQEELKSRELYGFLMACVYLPALELTPGNMPDMENVTEDQFMDDCFVGQFTNTAIQDRMRNLVRFAKRRNLFKYL